MQLIENNNNKGYLVVDEKNNYIIFQNSRPNYIKWYGYDIPRNLYLVNKIYKFDEIFDSNTINYKQYINKYYPGEKVFILYMSGYNKRYYDYSNYNLRNNDLNSIFIIFFKDCKKITELTPLEIKKIEDEKQKANESKIVESLLKDTVNTIVSKYGIKEHNASGCYYFESQKALNTFIFDALDKTVFEELRNNGFKVNKKSHRGKLGLSSLLFSTYDLGIGKEKE